MKIAGVIAEYNPFHSGHSYHLAKTRESGATHVVVVMSGSVVQRGGIAIDAAIFRAETAIRGGADLVLELPPQYSLSPARDFAKAGLNILRRLGCVDILSFGAEETCVEKLRKALDSIIANELSIKAGMSRGLTYPQAVAEACGGDVGDIILGQNNTLALEYLRALRGSGIEPLSIKRTVMHDSDTAGDGYASASMIRRLLREGGDVAPYLAEPPKEPAYLEDGEKAVLWRLSMMSESDFARVPYCGELSRRFYRATRRAESLDEVYSAVKSRNVTHARVRRVVMLATLGITVEDMTEPTFARVLAMNKRGAEVLRVCQKSATIPLGDSLAGLSRLSPEAKRQAELIEAASRFRALCAGRGKSEYRLSARMIT